MLNKTERQLIETKLEMHLKVQKEQVKLKKHERVHFDERFDRINTLKKWLQ